jgi:hypothetical protein
VAYDRARRQGHALERALGDQRETVQALLELAGKLPVHAAGAPAATTPDLRAAK